MDNLQHNDSLQLLDIHSNSITDKSVENIKQLLSSHKNLNVDIRDTHMSKVIVDSCSELANQGLVIESPANDSEEFQKVKTKVLEYYQNYIKDDKVGLIIKRGKS